MGSNIKHKFLNIVRGGRKHSDDGPSGTTSSQAGTSQGPPVTTDFDGLENKGQKPNGSGMQQSTKTETKVTQGDADDPESMFPLMYFHLTQLQKSKETKQVASRDIQTERATADQDVQTERLTEASSLCMVPSLASSIHQSNQTEPSELVFDQSISVASMNSLLQIIQLAEFRNHQDGPVERLSSHQCRHEEGGLLSDDQEEAVRSLWITSEPNIGCHFPRKGEEYESKTARAMSVEQLRQGKMETANAESVVVEAGAFVTAEPLVNEERDNTLVGQKEQSSHARQDITTVYRVESSGQENREACPGEKAETAVFVDLLSKLGSQGQILEPAGPSGNACKEPAEASGNACEKSVKPSENTNDGPAEQSGKTYDEPAELSCKTYDEPAELSCKTYDEPAELSCKTYDEPAEPSSNTCNQRMVREPTGRHEELETKSHLDLLVKEAAEDAQVQLDHQARVSPYGSPTCSSRRLKGYKNGVQPSEHLGILPEEPLNTVCYHSTEQTVPVTNAVLKEDSTSCRSATDGDGLLARDAFMTEGPRAGSVEVEQLTHSQMLEYAVRCAFSHGLGLTITIDVEKPAAESPVNNSVDVTEQPRLSSGFQSPHSLDENNVLENVISINSRSCCNTDQLPSFSGTGGRPLRPEVAKNESSNIVEATSKLKHLGDPNEEIEVCSSSLEFEIAKQKHEQQEGNTKENENTKELKDILQDVRSDENEKHSIGMIAGCLTKKSPEGSRKSLMQRMTELTLKDVSGLIDIYTLGNELVKARETLNKGFKKYKHGEKVYAKLCSYLEQLKAETNELLRLMTVADKQSLAVQRETDEIKVTLAAVNDAAVSQINAESQAQRLEPTMYRRYVAARTTAETVTTLAAIRSRQKALADLEVLVYRKQCILQHSLPNPIQEKNPTAKKTTKHSPKKARKAESTKIPQMACLANAAVNDGSHFVTLEIVSSSTPQPGESGTPGWVSDSSQSDSPITTPSPTSEEARIMLDTEII